MKRKYGLKWRPAAMVMTIVLAVGILALGGAFILIDSDWAARYAVQKLESASGQRLHVGTLAMHLRSTLRIDITQLSVAEVNSVSNQAPDSTLNTTGAGREFLRAKSAVFHISLLPLLIGRIRLADAEMEDVHLFAQGAAAGSRGLHVRGRAGDLSGLGKRGANTSFFLSADMADAARAGAGNIRAEGVLGLASDLTGTDLRVHVDLPAQSPLPALAGMSPRDLAAIRLDAVLRERNGDLDIGQLAFALGDLHVTGQGVAHLQSSPLHVEGRLQTDYLDWGKTTLDAGLPPPPKKPAGALFRNFRLDWPALQKINGFTADLGLQIGTLKLRSGVPLKNIVAQAQLQADRMTIPSFTADFMGGAVKADAVLTAHNRLVKLNVKASNISIEQWRDALHVPRLLTGGPLAVDASVSGGGASMNELAATLSGPVKLRMGHAVVRSSRADEAEFLLTGLIPALAGKRAEQMKVVCIVARLPFENGLASGASIAGARTESSQLLTDGVVDLRQQTLDLHGRVTGVDGSRLGASMFVGDVNVSGKLGKPAFQLDSRGVLGTAARIGAAILSLGLTAAGTAVWDANADDACRVASQHPRTKAPASGELAIPH
ncbi:MAG: hypothetical protein JWP38_1457 [Herbaspirillum sp.]|nr:hypothetical protein [Herbaspirillum sp.]